MYNITFTLPRTKKIIPPNNLYAVIRIYIITNYLAHCLGHFFTHNIS